MKEIKDWEAKVIINGVEQVGLPLPGCFIEGEIEGERVKKEALDIDMTKLIMIAKDDGKRYRLAGARQSYTELLNQYIEISKTKEVKVETIDITNMQKEDLER